MARSAAEIQKATFGKDHDTLAIRPPPLVVLWFYLAALDAFALLQVGHIALVVEVPAVADDCLILHPAHVFNRNDVFVTGRCDEDVRGFDNVIYRVDLVPLHCGLKSTDRIDFRDNYPASLSTQRLSATFADFTKAKNNGDLSAQHDICRPHQAVRKRMAAAIDVIEFTFGH